MGRGTEGSQLVKEVGTIGIFMYMYIVVYVTRYAKTEHFAHNVNLR